MGVDMHQGVQARCYTCERCRGSRRIAQAGDARVFKRIGQNMSFQRMPSQNLP